MSEEKTYSIPLRKEFQKAPKYKRAKKAITALKDFLKRHLKSDDIKIGKHLNEKIWKDGIKNPPHHVKVTAKKDENVIHAELTGYSFEDEKDSKKEKKVIKKEKKPVEEKKEEPKPVVKEPEKKEETTDSKTES